jgi:hypothetical protein
MALSNSELAARRRRLLERHAELAAEHRTLHARPGVLADYQQLSEDLREHLVGLDAYREELEGAAAPREQLLETTNLLDQAERMWVSAEQAAANAQDAWRKAVETYKKVRDLINN